MMGDEEVINYENFDDHTIFLRKKNGVKLIYSYNCKKTFEVLLRGGSKKIEADFLFNFDEQDREM
jgi:hypothetical protein